MARRRWVRAVVTVVVAVLLTVISGGTTAGIPPAAQRDGADAVLSDDQARIPALMARKHIPAPAPALVDGDRVVSAPWLRLPLNIRPAPTEV